MFQIRGVSIVNQCVTVPDVPNWGGCVRLSLIYFSLNNTINERNYTWEKKSVNKVFFIDLVLSRRIFMLKDAKCVVMGKGFGNPLENPYPHQGSGVTLGICHRFFVYTNLLLLFLLLPVLYNLYMVNINRPTCCWDVDLLAYAVSTAPYNDSALTLH